MVDFPALRRLASAAAMAAVVLALPPAALAQVSQQSATGGAQAGDSGGDSNEHGWPTDYVAQVGAGTTNGATTGYSGTRETPTDSPEPSLPELPSAQLCEKWKGSEIYPFCMEKLVE